MLSAGVIRLSLFRINNVLLRLNVGNLHLNDRKRLRLLGFRSKKFDNVEIGAFHARNLATYAAPFRAG